jgi:hypothetical protein
VIFIVVIGSFSLVTLCTPGAHSGAMYLFLAFFSFLFPTALFPPYGGLFVGPVWIVGYPLLRHRLKPWSKDFAKRHPWLAGFGSGGSGFGGSENGGGGGSGGGLSTEHATSALLAHKRVRRWGGVSAAGKHRAAGSAGGGAAPV